MIEISSEKPYRHSNGYHKNDTGNRKLKKRKHQQPFFTIPKAIVIFAKKNGNESGYVRVVGNSICELLTNATRLLQLPRAARKLFDENGNETFEKEIDQYSKWSVSQGEGFIDPMIKIREDTQISLNTFWGLNGVYIPKSKPKVYKTPALGKNLAKLYRVLAFSGSHYLMDESIEILTDGTDFDEFCYQCSCKFQFNGQNPKIFLHDTTEVTSMSNILIEENSFIWDSKLKIPVFGPVWVTMSNDLDISSVKSYFSIITNQINHFLKVHKAYLKELIAMDEGEVEKVKTNHIKSYSKKELKYRIEENQKMVDRFKVDLKRFKDKLNAIENIENSVEKKTPKDVEEKNACSSIKCLRMKVYINGKSSKNTSYAYFNLNKLKFIVEEKEKELLMDSLSTTVFVSKQNDCSRGLLVRRLFRESGEEIKNVKEIKYDDTICVSFGEDWIPLVDFTAAVKFFFVNENQEECQSNLVLSHKKLKEFKRSDRKFEDEEYSAHSIFQHKEDKLSFIVPVAQVIEKETHVENGGAQSKTDEHNNKTNTMIYSNWIFTKDGVIFCMSMPNICLALDDRNIHKFDYEDGDKKVEVQFYPTCIGSTKSGLPTNYWGFNQNGLLYNKAHQNFYLTHWKENDCFNSDLSDLRNALLNSNLIACESLSTDENKTQSPEQRWAFRQCKMGKWKNCYLPNPEWNKRGFIWPLNEERTGPNENLRWPLQGILMAGAPPALSRSNEQNPRFPRKLKVLKNNDHRSYIPTLVVGPDLTKYIKSNDSFSKGFHCSGDLLKIEFKMFLDTCTDILKLNSAARRLFTKWGTEIFDLSDLNNDDIVFVSTGESWSRPQIVRGKMQLRSIANKMTVDVERLRCFLQLHDPLFENFVLGFRDNLVEDDCIVQVQNINTQIENELYKLRYPDEKSIQTPVPSEISDASTKNMTFHERHCDAAQLKWKIKEGIDGNESIASKPQIGESNTAPLSQLTPQHLVVQFGTISSKMNPQLCVYADAIGRPVIWRKKTDLMAAKEEDKFKWIIHSNGAIESRYFRGFVLTIACQKMLPFHDKSSYCYDGSEVNLDRAINAKYGKAYQRFNYNPSVGILFAFSTNQKDLSTTAAILSGICTRYISNEPINQSAFYVTMKGEKKLICQSCVTVLNGKYPIEQINEKPESFQCDYRGGFKIIKGPDIDLSYNNANETFQRYLNQLSKLRKDLLIKPCKNRVMPTIPNLHVQLYLNGHGRNNEAKCVTGRSIGQIMETAASVFNLQRVVRILYTCDGVPITDDISYRNYIVDMRKVASSDDIKPLPTINENELIGYISKDETKWSDFEKKLQVNLSDDGSLIIVEFEGETSFEYYELEIVLLNVSDTAQFIQDDKFTTMMIISYDIFGSQIVTSAFQDDEEFEVEATIVTIKSSKAALIELFTNSLSKLQFQLFSAQSNDEPNIDGFGASIKSMNAFCEIPMKILATRLAEDELDNHCTLLEEESKKYKIEEELDSVFLSAEDFSKTTASILVKVSLCRLKNITDFEEEEIKVNELEEKSSLMSGSVILEPQLYNNRQNKMANEINQLELWVSQGEQFSWPNEDKIKQRQEAKKQEKINILKSEIDNRKFLLRNLRGERKKNCNPGTLEPTPSERNPVKIKGNWQFPTREEIDLENEIKEFENQLKTLKTKGSVVNLTRELYKQKHLKKVLVRINGDSSDNVYAIWAENIHDLMDNAAQQLNLKKTPKFIFDSKGYEISTLRNLDENDLFTLADERIFLSIEDTKLNCQVKANWGRARRQHGPDATELHIDHRPITVIDVDPFEAPALLKGDKELPDSKSKTVSVFENGQSPANAKTITGRTLQELIKKAQEILNLPIPVKCFYTMDGRKISYFREILYDDTLAASVSRKGFIKYENDV